VLHACVQSSLQDGLCMVGLEWRDVSWMLYKESEGAIVLQAVAVV
jgi:hypothetical protein